MKTKLTFMLLLTVQLLPISVRAEGGGVSTGSGITQIAKKIKAPSRPAPVRTPASSIKAH